MIKSAMQSGFFKNTVFFTNWIPSAERSDNRNVFTATSVLSALRAQVWRTYTDLGLGIQIFGEDSARMGVECVAELRWLA